MRAVVVVSVLATTTFGRTSDAEVMRVSQADFSTWVRSRPILSHFRSCLSCKLVQVWLRLEGLETVPASCQPNAEERLSVTVVDGQGDEGFVDSGSGIATAKAVEAVRSRLKEYIVDVAVATEVCSFFFRAMFLSC